MNTHRVRKMRVASRDSNRTRRAKTKAIARRQQRALVGVEIGLLDFTREPLHFQGGVFFDKRWEVSY